MAPARCWIMVCVWLLAGIARGEVAAVFSVDAIQGDDWRAQGISITLRSSAAASASAVVEIEYVDLPGGHGALRGLVLDCLSLQRDDRGWHCDEGRLRLKESPLAAQAASWQGMFQSAGHWSIRITQLTIGPGSLAVTASAQAAGWSMAVRPHRVPVERIDSLIPGGALPADWGVVGRASGVVELAGQSSDPARLVADLVIDRLNYASPDGRQAGENLLVKIGLSGRADGAGWSFDTNLAWPSGAAYSEPLFLDASQTGLQASAQGSWRPQRDILELDAWSVDLANTGRVSGTGRADLRALAIEQLTIVVNSERAGQFYEKLLQPFLIGTAGDDLDAAGNLGIVLHFDRAGVEQAGLELNDLQIEDRQGRFAIGPVEGSIGWDRASEVPRSRLQVERAHIYRIPLGSFDIEAKFAGDQLELIQPLVIPVLDGQAALDSFRLSGALVAGESPHWQASVSLRNISLPQLTAAFGWPPFAGAVTASLQDMRYADQRLSVGGGFDLKAFDGAIEIRDLQIGDPLGGVPILEADATLRGLSLAKLTQAFSFGRIEGRLDGNLEDLRLVAWQPDSFDLHLFTPPDDDSRHRISQRAVENLTELGSGIPAGLSVSLLSLFEEFGYDKIDLRVSLRGDRAELDGLARDDGGYYLVKGAGLPRIDVIGRNRSVAWKDLVERLRRIQVEGAAVK